MLALACWFGLDMGMDIWRLGLYTGIDGTDAMHGLFVNISRVVFIMLV